MRFRNPIFGILSFVVVGLLLHIFKETSWAIFVERLLEEVAHSLHIERAAMVATLSQILIGGGLLWAALYFAFWVGKAERQVPPDPIVEAARAHADAIRAQTQAMTNQAPSAARAAKQVVIDPTWVRDTPLGDAFWRAYSGEWSGRKEINLPSPEADKLYKAADQIRQHAFEGALPIWAKKRRSRLYELVPAEFWQNHSILPEYSIHTLADDVFIYVTHPLLVGEVPHARTLVWEDFMTSKDAVQKLWPATA